MKKGGYQIVDFKNINLVSGTGVVVSGIYETIEGNYRKPILISGLIIDGVELPDCFVWPISGSGGAYAIQLPFGRNMAITSEDSVTVS